MVIGIHSKTFRMPDSREEMKLLTAPSFTQPEPTYRLRTIVFEQDGIEYQARLVEGALISLMDSRGYSYDCSTVNLKSLVSDILHEEM